MPFLGLTFSQKPSFRRLLRCREEAEMMRRIRKLAALRLPHWKLMTFCWSSDCPGVLVTFDDEEFLAVCFFFLRGVGAGDLLVKYDLARCTSTVVSFPAVSPGRSTLTSWHPSRSWLSSRELRVGSRRSWVKVSQFGRDLLRMLVCLGCYFGVPCHVEETNKFRFWMRGHCWRDPWREY